MRGGHRQRLCLCFVCQGGCVQADTGGEIHVLSFKPMAGRPSQATSFSVRKYDGKQAGAGGANNVRLVNWMASGDGIQVHRAGVDNFLPIIATAHVECTDTT